MCIIRAKNGASTKDYIVDQSKIEILTSYVYSELDYVEATINDIDFIFFKNNIICIIDG